MTSPDTSAVEDALAAVAETQAQLNDTQALLAAQTRELQDQLLLLGMDLHNTGEPADRGLIRRLYWDTPSLHTQAIYEAFGLRSPNDVGEIAGHRELTIPCKDCGTERVHKVKNRSQLAKLRAGYRCQPCTATADERARQHRAELDAEWQRRNAEEREGVRRAMEAYVLAHPDLPEEPDGEAFYVDISDPRRGNSTVRLADLNAVRRELAERRRS